MKFRILQENIPIIAMVWFYIAISFTIQGFFGLHGAMQLIYFSSPLFYICVFFTILFFILNILRNSHKNYLSINYPIGFIVILIHAPLFESTFASFKQMIPRINDFCWDYDLMRLDQALHFGHHPWKLLEPILNYPRILYTIDYLYMIWFILLFLICLWMGWTKRRKLRLHFFCCSLLVWIILGSGMGTVFSSAGPCYYTQVVSAQPNPYEPLMSRLHSIHGKQPLTALINQSGLWQAKLENKWLPFGGISAMPSIHVAIAFIFLLVAWRVNLWLGILFTLYLIIIQIGAVILGWHYAIDGYVSAFLTFFIWKAVGKMLDRYYPDIYS